VTALNLNLGTMSPDNLTISQTGSSSVYGPMCQSIGSRDTSSGRYYLEFTVNDSNPTADEAVGIGMTSHNWYYNQMITSDGAAWGAAAGGGSKTADTGLVFSPSCVVGMAVGDNQLWFRVNTSNWNGTNDWSWRYSNY
jgi:hypothetical protein